MEQQNKYYTPDISELHVGYECELYNVVQRKWFARTLNGYDIEELYMHFPETLEVDLRTKYLDQSDIESLGWVHTGGQMISDGRKDYEKGNWCLCYNTRHHTLNVFIKDPSLEENYPSNCGTFRGECKSINELRKIIKWLNIK